MEQQINKPSVEEQEIDLIELAKGLWARKTLIIKVAMIGAIVGVMVALSIPKEYTSGAKLAPEVASGGSSSLGSLGGLAAMAGINVGGANSGGDAISANLYPNVVSSVPFIAELFDQQVTTLDEEINTTLYDYMENEQRGTWWGYLMSLPFKALGAVIDLFKSEEEIVGDGGVNVEALTKDQFDIYEAIRDRVSVSVDTKTFVISLSVKMQDPKVAADIANVVKENLQIYISEYRTQKVKQDLAYSQKMFDEARERYFDAQKLYATFEDENKNITSSRYRTEQERLRNDMSLSYSLYSNIATSLEETKLRVQEKTPVYAVIEPVTRPINSSEPNRMMILIAFTFLAGCAVSAYVIFKDKLIEF